MVIAQSGGPSMVINQSLVGAILEAKKYPQIGKILGARHGITGILARDYIELGKVYMAVSSKAGVMTATFHVQSEEAKQALES